MPDETDPPIDEPGYLHGVTVVDIGDYRVSRGMSRRTFSGCYHHRLTYDQNERRIWCRDCERDVEPFDAFLGLVEHFANAQYSLKREREELEEATKFQVRSLAAKVIDKAWRRKNSVPMCPHCSRGLYPEDFKNGVGMVGREFAEATRKRDGAN